MRLGFRRPHAGIIVEQFRKPYETLSNGIQVYFSKSLGLRYREVRVIGVQNFGFRGLEFKVLNEVWSLGFHPKLHLKSYKALVLLA